MVLANALIPGPFGQPGRKGGRLPVLQEVLETTRLNVDEYGSVDPALALRVLVHTNHAGRGAGRIRQQSDQPHQCVPADPPPESVRHSGVGPAHKRETDQDQRGSQPLRPLTESAGEERACGKWWLLTTCQSLREILGPMQVRVTGAFTRPGGPVRS